MSYVPPVKKEAAAEGAEQVVHRIRITLTSRNVGNLEKVCVDLKKGAVDKKLQTQTLTPLQEKNRSSLVQSESSMLMALPVLPRLCRG